MNDNPMNDNQRFDDLDHLLAQRKAPSEPLGLAAQIIARAANEPARAFNAGHIRGWFGELYAGLYLPQPALACMLVLFIGVMIGTEMEWIMDPTVQDWAGLFTTNENWGDSWS